MISRHIFDETMYRLCFSETFNVCFFRSDDPSLDYHNLEGVHNGGEAMDIFPKIEFMPPEEQAKARHNLLKYCELDTYAMVKVWQELERVAK